jgi:FtsP/CotA-like multicopper oxidase with cupredoxin domain
MKLSRRTLRSDDRCRMREWPVSGAHASTSRQLVAGSAVAAMLLLVAPADAQEVRKLPQARTAPPSEWVNCAAPGQPLIRIPEIVSQNGQLRGTIVLQDDQQMRLQFKQSTGVPRCAPQRVRNFVALDAVLPGYPGEPPPGYGGVPPIPVNQTADPVPGPTLRARVGDIVQLTFVNQVNPNHYGDSIDRGERGQGCDEVGGAYPGLDQYPDCFHGSSTGNIHFHGTHTNPGSTGDNVFVEIRPSLRDDNRPIVTPESVKGPFDEFFSLCEVRLKNNVMSQWPRSWNDLPKAWTTRQEALLKAYDSNPAIKNKLWPVNEAQIKADAWPQYYVGAYPYCFALPRFVPPTPGQAAQPAAHDHGGAEQSRALVMGQSPGTHWYHAHKHGSTTINVANGMTGAFIIEGSYDDALNGFYGQGWTRRQPVLVLNQLGVSPNLMRRGGQFQHEDISVNGRMQPKLTMRPGEVQLWRIANTSSRSGVMIRAFNAPTSPAGIVFGRFQWKQTAQDGVQFVGPNYQSSVNPQLVIAPGNRADILVQAPPTTTPAGQPYTLMIRQVRSQCETLDNSQVPTIPTSPTNPAKICSPDSDEPLLTVEVSGAPVTGNEGTFIPQGQLQASFPPFLGDITDSEIKATKVIEFESTQTTGFPVVMHTIDGHKFDGNIGQVVLLNTAEEWKIVNRTVNGSIRNNAVTTSDPPGVVDHPFHIHINPFQITEVFDPNEVLPGTATPRYIFQGQPQTGQCLLDITKPETWKPCVNNVPQTNRIWWDVFMIPSARAVFTGSGANLQMTVVPGYFKMRSRFVDFSGQYVIHCHILAHEDRGMMTIVQVAPFITPYSHK